MKKAKRKALVVDGRKDSARLDFLEADGWGVICDDHGRWALPDGGHQNLLDSKGRRITREPIDVESTLYVPARYWKPTIREAIDAAMRRAQRGTI